MPRSQRASAAAAAKKIAVQAADHDDATAEHATSGGGSGDARRKSATTTTTLPRRPVAAKRKRDSESPEYEDGAGNDEGDDDEDDDDDDGDEEEASQSSGRAPAPKRLTIDAPIAKKAKKARRPTNNGVASPLEQRLFSRSGRPATADQVPPACCPPERLHSVDYHRPLLLDGTEGWRARRALLAWYDSVSATRGMPWRRAWLDPAAGLAGTDAGARSELARRAYEVWISEVMAQQTRIAVVIGYWTRWMARWPTLPDLAAATSSDVFQEWSGLGYYSRASRVHEAAKLVATDPVFQGLLPPDVATLESRIPGVGRYTAGAVSAIVYGRAAPMVDGNVIRVLSRQLGVFADSKADKALVDLLWAAAEALVQAVARDGPGEGDETDDDSVAVSDRSGRWGQALMELGSTVCAPKPDCAGCPISTTCRSYAEGLALHERNTMGVVLPLLVKKEDGDDDLCNLCEQFPELDEEEAAALAKVDKKEKEKEKEKNTKKAEDKVKTSPFFDVEDAAAGVTLSKETLATIVGHARTFPLRRPKKPVREVETLVCAVRLANKKGLYLLHQRPAKGLLASLWQLPSYDLPVALDSKAARRKEAEAFVARWLKGASSSDNEDASAEGAKKGAKAKKGSAKAIATLCMATTATAISTNLRIAKAKEMGSIPWLFSHLRQTMYVYLFEMAPEDGGSESMSNLPTPASCCWASVAEAETTYSMGTGMRKCWALVKEA